MKTPEILHDLNNCLNAVETNLLTTIHLINGNKIVTKSDAGEEDIKYEDAYCEFFFAGF